MTIKGIDVSSHDNYNGSTFKANTEEAYLGADFCIVKATQGITYTYARYSEVAERVLADGKLLGFYHYAGGNDAAAEAERFWDAVKAYNGKAVPCLDWESIQNKAWYDSDWCNRFVTRYHELSNVWALIYVQASAVGQCANCADRCGLWVAGYTDNRNSWEVPAFRYSIAPWKTPTIWQYSSSNGATDRNVAYLDAEGWAKIAQGEGAQPAEAPSTSVPPASCNGDIAAVQTWAGAVADGIYGPKTRASLIKVLQSELNNQYGKGLAVDGIWGPKTQAACVNVRRGAKGRITKCLQGGLICNGYSTDGFDGIFGAGTETAVKQFQAARGIGADGIAGKQTFAKLFG